MIGNVSSCSPLVAELPAPKFCFWRSAWRFAAIFTLSGLVEGSAAISLNLRCRTRGFPTMARSHSADSTDTGTIGGFVRSLGMAIERFCHPAKCRHTAACSLIMQQNEHETRRNSMRSSVLWMSNSWQNSVQSRSSYPCFHKFQTLVEPSWGIMRKNKLIIAQWTHRLNTSPSNWMKSIAITAIELHINNQKQLGYVQEKLYRDHVG